MFSALASSVQRALVMIGTIHLIVFVAATAVLCVAAFFLIRIAIEFLRFRAPALVVCPATGQTAIIRIDALHAAVSGMLKDPELRVCACSRWPEQKGCRHECLG